MKKRLAVMLAALMLLTLMIGCNDLAHEPETPHGNHNLTHDTPHTHGPSIDIETTNPRSVQRVEFVPVMAQTSKAVRIHELTVTVTNLSLMVDLATNLVKGDTYTVHFALADVTGNAVASIAPDGATMKEYEGTSTFSAVQSASFLLPDVAPGEYTLLAYVAAADGTRVSEYAQVVFTDIVEFEVQEGDTTLKTVKGDGNSLTLICERSHEGELAA